MGNELRLAFVGCGAIAQWHLDAVRKAATRTRVSAAIDVDAGRAQALADAAGGAAFTSLGDAIAADAFDAALVMLPHHLHEDAAIAVLEAGKHLLLEKPMAPTLEACERILSVAATRDVVFQVAENAQYWPEIVAVRGLIADGTLGDIITARSWHCAPPMADFHQAGAWRMAVASAGGGVAMDAGSHWLRPLRMWLGEMTETFAVTGRPFPEMEGESMTRALCRFDSGVVASFDAILTPGPAALAPMFQVTGTKGEVLVEPLGEVRLFDGSDWRGTVVERGNYMLSYERQIAAFEAALLDGAPLPVDAAYALGELRAALAMYRSAESQRWEPVW